MEFITVFLVISVFCYQIFPLLFFVFVMVFELIDFNKKYINKIILAGVFVIIAMIINYGASVLIHNCFTIEKTAQRISELKINEISFYFIIYNMKTICISFFSTIMIYSDGLFYKGGIIIFLVMISNLFSYSLDKENTRPEIMKYLFLIIGIYFVSNSFHFFTNYAIFSARFRSGIGALVGLMSVYILANNNLLKTDQVLKKFFGVIITLYFVANILNYSYLINAEKKINNEEKEIAISINDYVKKYEDDNNVTIDEIVLVYDREQTLYSSVSKRNDWCNALFAEWSAKGVVNYYSNNKYKKYNTIEESQIEMDNKYQVIDNKLYLKIHKF